MSITPRATSPQDLLDEIEASLRTGMSVHWFRRKRWSGGGIPFIKMGDGAKGAVRYRGADVDAFISARVRRSTSDSGQAA